MIEWKLYKKSRYDLQMKDIMLDLQMSIEKSCIKGYTFMGVSWVKWLDALEKNKPLYESI